MIVVAALSVAACFAFMTWFFAYLGVDLIQGAEGPGGFLGGVVMLGLAVVTALVGLSVLLS